MVDKSFVSAGKNPNDSWGEAVPEGVPANGRLTCLRFGKLSHPPLVCFECLGRYLAGDDDGEIEGCSLPCPLRA